MQFFAVAIFISVINIFRRTLRKKAIKKVHEKAREI